MLVLSGIQPTGKLHLGNYLGAIKNWVKMQDESQTLFMIADLHAITIEQNPKALKEHIGLTAATLMACGIKKESNIFQQSKHSIHSDLAWVLSTMTPMSWLDRMTQYKDKVSQKVHSSMGLYAYPVLMAADILGYHATHVPVGEDQVQHLQLVRDLAGAFNRRYNIDFFPLPDAIITIPCTRVKSLQDGTKKMSKSSESDYDRINLTDTADEIKHKFTKAKSDSLNSITYDPENRPEIANLLEIYSAMTGKSIEQLVDLYSGKYFSVLKSDLADVVIAEIEPISKKIIELMKNQDVIREYLEWGNDSALERYEPILNKVHEIVGF